MRSDRRRPCVVRSTVAGMTSHVFLHLAAAAEDALRRDALATRWSEDSALAGYSIGGLAGHLARAVLTVDRYLDEPATAGEPTDPAGYLVRVLGTHDPVTSALHTGVRARGDEEAANGPIELADRIRDARCRLGERLATTPPGQPIEVLDGVVLTLDDYLRTRVVELVIHLDDLGVSLGGDVVDVEDAIPDEAYAITASVLAQVAVARVGGRATVRSLARRERHPDAVRAL